MNHFSLQMRGIFDCIFAFLSGLYPPQYTLPLLLLVFLLYFINIFLLCFTFLRPCCPLTSNLNIQGKPSYCCFTKYHNSIGPEKALIPFFIYFKYSGVKELLRKSVNGDKEEMSCGKNSFYGTRSYRVICHNYKMTIVICFYIRRLINKIRD